MKILGGFSEKGVVIGNTCDRFYSGNPVAHRIMLGFESTFSVLD